MKMNDELSLMKELFSLLILTLFWSAPVCAQFVTRPDTISVKDNRPVYTETIASDPDVSSFLIVIEKGVPAHLHKAHTEYVVVISGEAKLYLDDSQYHIRPGDLIYIPALTIHEVEVLGEEPLRVVSIQSPEFKGRDRYFIPMRGREEEKREEGQY